MRAITQSITAAFEARKAKSIGNSSTDGTTLRLHGNPIARWRNGSIEVTVPRNWDTPTTRERLNGLSGVHVTHRAGELYLNGKIWDGEWTTIARCGTAGCIAHWVKAIKPEGRAS